MVNVIFLNGPSRRHPPPLPVAMGIGPFGPNGSPPSGVGNPGGAKPDGKEGNPAGNPGREPFVFSPLPPNPVIGSNKGDLSHEPPLSGASNSQSQS